MTNNHNCIHEELIQSHNMDIGTLKTRSDYKETRIEELNDKIDKLTDKVDDLNNSVNNVILASKTEDSDLNVRLTKVETDNANLKDSIQQLKDDREKEKKEAQRRFTNQTAIISIIFTIITIIISVYFNTH